MEQFDVVVVGGGPAGSTAAWELAKAGHSVLLLDRAGRIKPCGGAIPPQVLRDFDIPESLLVAQISSARMISPSDQRVDMPIDGGFVGMVDRDSFDEWLRERAAKSGATRRVGTFFDLERDAEGNALVRYTPEGAERGSAGATVKARCVIGADGATSKVARKAGIPGIEQMQHVHAYHEIVRSPESAAPGAAFDPTRCDVYYQGDISPDFYGWVFPHGEHTSVGVGTMIEGFSLRDATRKLREAAGLGEVETIRREGAPIPLKPLKRWDNGRDVIVIGDATGVVAPASGEGIYYAMTSGRMGAEAVDAFIATGDAAALKTACKKFMKAHGRVFWILGIMQRFWYANDRRRERFVSICRDKDVQHLTWEAYMNKRLVRAKPAAHVRIFLKDMAHLLGIVSPRAR